MWLVLDRGVQIGHVVGVQRALGQSLVLQMVVVAQDVIQINKTMLLGQTARLVLAARHLDHKLVRVDLLGLLAPLLLLLLHLVGGNQSFAVFGLRLLTLVVDGWRAPREAARPLADSQRPFTIWLLGVEQFIWRLLTRLEGQL